MKHGLRCVKLKARHHQLHLSFAKGLCKNIQGASEALVPSLSLPITMEGAGGREGGLRGSNRILQCIYIFSRLTNTTTIQFLFTCPHPDSVISLLVQYSKSPLCNVIFPYQRNYFFASFFSLQWNTGLTIYQGGSKMISLNREYRYTGVLPHTFYYNFC